MEAAAIKPRDARPVPPPSSPTLFPLYTLPSLPSSTSSLPFFFRSFPPSSPTRVPPAATPLTMPWHLALHSLRTATVTATATASLPYWMLAFTKSTIETTFSSSRRVRGSLSATRNPTMRLLTVLLSISWISSSPNKSFI